MLVRLLSGILSLCFIFNSIQAQSYAELDSLALTFTRNGKSKEGFSILQRRLKEARLHYASTDSVFLSALSWAAWGAVENEAYATAEKYYLEFLEGLIPGYGKENAYYANDLGMLGYVYSEMGKYNKAAEIMEESRSILNRIMDDSRPSSVVDYGIIVNNLALLYIDMHRYEQAEMLFRESLSLKFYEDDDKLVSLSNFSRVLDLQGKNTEAELNYHKLLRMEKEFYGGNDERIAKTLTDIAGFYFRNNNQQLAKSYLQEALSISNSISRQLLLGRIFQKEEQYEEAAQQFHRALLMTLKKFGNQHPFMADIYNAKAKLMMEQNRYGAAEKDLLNALESNSPEMKEKKGEIFLDDAEAIESYQMRSAIAFRQKNYIDAKQYIDQALSIQERFRKDLNLEKDKYFFQQSYHQLTESAIEIALAMKDVPLAFTYAETNKSALLKDAFHFEEKLPSHRLEAKRVLLNQYMTYKAAYFQEDGPGKDSLLVLLNQKEAELRTLEVGLHKDFPHLYQQQAGKQLLDIPALQATIGEEKVLLEYFIGEEKCYLFMMDAHELDYLVLPVAARTVRKRVRAFRAHLTDFKALISDEQKAYQHFVNDARWFYKQFLTPAEAFLQEKQHYIIIPDADLFQIPFSSLLTEEPSSDFNDYNRLPYLINNAALSYHYSSAFLLHPKPSVQKNIQLLAMAAHYPGHEAFGPIALRGGLTEDARNKLRPLPSAAAEVDMLSRLFKGAFFKDSATTEARFKREASKYQIIHLAMHGMVDLEEPILSGLAFSDSKDSLEDDFLQAYEIASMHLNADLVVLSACETGYGQLAVGEGLRSLARAFMRAGVPALVVSLWQVNDRISAEIMKRFYVNIKAGQDKAQALRNAQLDYLKNNKGNSVHPAFWSSFVVMGDARPLKFEKPLNLRVYGSIGALLLLGGLLFFWSYRFKRKNS